MAHNPSRSKAPVKRVTAMALAMADIAAERGACTEADLKSRGFKPDELRRHGDAAKRIAADLAKRPRANAVRVAAPAVRW